MESEKGKRDARDRRRHPRFPEDASVLCVEDAGEGGFHQIAAEARDNDRFLDAGSRQPRQLPFEHAATGQIEQALGQVLGQWQQPAALACTEDDGPVCRSAHLS